MIWERIDDGRAINGDVPSTRTRTFRMRLSNANGWLYRTETNWPSGLVTESMAFVPMIGAEGV